MNHNNQNYLPLHPGLSSSGYQLFIHTNALGFLNEAIQDDFASFQLIKNIISMRSNPRPWDGGIKKGTADHRQMAVDGILITYLIKNGTVYIDDIKLNPSAQAKHEPAGLHHIVKDTNGWRINETYVREIKTHYAAVNGQANDRERAALVVIPPILEHSYAEEDIKEFTLFHNPTVSFFSDTYESLQDKLGFTTPMTKRFARLLLDTQQKSADTRWAAHSQGGAIFTQAVNYHNKTVSSPLSGHTVFFSACANNMLITKKILKKPG